MSLAFMPGFMFAASAGAGEGKTLATQLCGSNRIIYITLPADDESPDYPGHMLSGCHAICAEEDEIDEDKETL